MDSFLKSLAQSRLLGFALIAAVVLAAYSFMLNAPFRGMDDSVMIVNNKDIRSFDNVGKLFTSSFFGDRSYYRPLVPLTYMIEYSLFGLDSFFYNLDNVILHVLNAFAVYFLIFRLMRDRLLAWWVSFLFAIHPVQWEAVANVSGRVILLKTLFILLSFIWFIDFRERRRALCLLGSLLSFILACFCKESAAMLPVMFLLYLALFPEPQKGKGRPWFAVTPFFLAVFGVVLLRQQLGITELFTWGSVDATLRGFLTFARGLITYLRLYIFPVDLYFDRSRVVFANFTDPELLFTVGFWLLVIGALWKFKARIDAKIFFFIFWFAFEFAPVSQIVTSIGVQPGFISLAEHFLYVPSIAVFTVTVIGVRYLVRLNASRRFIGPGVLSITLAGLMMFCFMTTIQQNIYASNDLAMLKRSIESQPFNSRVQYSIGMYYANRGMYAEAEETFAKAVEIDPYNVRAKIALGKALCDQDKLIDCVNVYESIRNAGSQQGLLGENLRLSYKLLKERYPWVVYE